MKERRMILVTEGRSEAGNSLYDLCQNACTPRISSPSQKTSKRQLASIMIKCLSGNARFTIVDCEMEKVGHLDG